MSQTSNKEIQGIYLAKNVASKNVENKPTISYAMALRDEALREMYAQIEDEGKELQGSIRYHLEHADARFHNSDYQQRMWFWGARHRANDFIQSEGSVRNFLVRFLSRMNLHHHNMVKAFFTDTECPEDTLVLGGWHDNPFGLRFTPSVVFDVDPGNIYDISSLHPSMQGESDVAARQLHLPPPNSDHGIYRGVCFSDMVIALNRDKDGQPNPPARLEVVKSRNSEQGKLNCVSGSGLQFFTKRKV